MKNFKKENISVLEKEHFSNEEIANFASGKMYFFFRNCQLKVRMKVYLSQEIDLTSNRYVICVIMIQEKILYNKFSLKKTKLVLK